MTSAGEAIWPEQNLKRIGVFSPSDPITEARSVDIKQTAVQLASAGIDTVFSPHAFSAEYDTVSASIDQRISDLEFLIDHGQIDFAMAAWGGKGCNQIVPHLPYEKIRASNFRICGFSDASILCVHVTMKTGVSTFYGPNVFGKLRESDFGNLHQFSRSFRWSDFNLINSSYYHRICGTSTQGRLFASNLSCFINGIICSDLKTSDFDGTILLMEGADDDLRIYEQQLYALRNIGLISRLNGLVLAPFKRQLGNCSLSDWENGAVGIASRVCEGIDIHACLTDVTGHGRMRNPAIPIGFDSYLDTRAGVLLTNFDL